MSRALHLVGTQDARPASPCRLSPLMALVALEPALLAQEDVALVEFASDPPEVLGPNDDVSEASAAQMALDWFVEYLGVYRKTDGDRARSMYSHLTRYVVPHLIEVALDQDEHSRTVEVLTFKQARVLAEMLAGSRPWPAATVAGDALNRSATTCVWLTVADAAIVSHGDWLL